MTQIITATKAAIGELKIAAESEGTSPRIRLAMLGGGCAGLTIKMDFTKLPPDSKFDIVQEQDGVEFIIDLKSASYLQDAVLDFNNTNLLERGFQWSFPNSTGSCGCGTSFSF